MKRTPRWISIKTVLAIHKDQIDQFGGSFLIRDMGLLESALNRPQNLYHYNEDAVIFELAAAYCFGIAKNHPFVDGNKRVSFQTMYVFLGLNGYDIIASESAVVEIMLGLAGSMITENQLSDWLSKNTKKR